MARLAKILVLIMSLLPGFGATALASTEKRDIILLLDNSNSMQFNDPNFLTRKSAFNFLNRLTGNTRIGIILFGEAVSVAAPLTPVSEKIQDSLATHLDKLSYTGRHRNTAAGLERAIYELKTQGRPEAEKAIVLITDGNIETGDKKRNRDFSRWVQEYLANEAAKANIKIFGIAFTEAADFHLIQILAHTTGGVYYRAPKAKDLLPAFNQIRKAILGPDTIVASPPTDTAGSPPETPSPTPSASVPEPTGSSSLSAPTSEKQSLPSPPEPSTARKAPEDHVAPSLLDNPWIQDTIAWLKKRWKLVAALAGLIVLVLLITMAVIKRSQRRTQVAEPVSPPHDSARKYIPPAQLVGMTRPSHYDITGKLTWISRAPGENSKETATIYIKDDTISRDHAFIQYRDYGYWISDRGSANGTFVNEEKVIGERSLQNGDRIRFAQYEFKFIMPHRTDMADTQLIQPGYPDDRTELIHSAGGGSTEPAEPRSAHSPPNDEEEEATEVRPAKRTATHAGKQQR